jgi:hypothetical protein
VTRRRTAAAELDAVRADRAAIATDPNGPPAEAELPSLRCHWVRLTDQPPDIDPWVLIPGCDGLAADPFGVCGCDRLQRRLDVHVQQRRELDERFAQQRGRLRAWSRAGAAAWAQLTGRPEPGGCSPEDLARAVRGRTPHV